MRIGIKEIKVNPRHRKTEPNHIRELADSITGIGLLNPITVDKHFVLIAGLHRLEAVKSLGWEEIECCICDLEGLQAEMAEIDENYIRLDLGPTEQGEMLLRRKEIYEALHPETKYSISQGMGMRRKADGDLVANLATRSKTFVEDTSEKLGIAPRTIRRQVQIAKNLTPEAKEVLKSTDAKITQENILKLSKLDPDQQEKAASQLTSGKIHSVDEYRTGDHINQDHIHDQRKPDSKPAYVIELEQEKIESPRKKQPATVTEIIADLKNHDKDASATPEMFLASITSFAVRTEEEIAWYGQEYYQPVFPRLSSEQMSQLHDVVRRIGASAENIYTQVKKFRKKGSAHAL